jgi:hypothetical protein
MVFLRHIFVPIVHSLKMYFNVARNFYRINFSCFCFGPNTKSVGVLGGEGALFDNCFVVQSLLLSKHEFNHYLFRN